MLRPVAFLINRQRPPHQRLGLLQPVRGLQQLREVVEVAGDIGMLRPVAFLINRQRSPHQRLGLLQPVRGLQQLREVVEGGGDIGMLLPELFSSIASARRINGSASSSRFVACNNARGC